MTEEKTVIVSLCRNILPRFVISYKDKDKLYEELFERMKNLDCPEGKLYYDDQEGEHTLINNADDLVNAIRDDAHMRLFLDVPEDDDSKIGSEFEVIQRDGDHNEADYELSAPAFQPSTSSEDLETSHQEERKKQDPQRKSHDPDSGSHQETHRKCYCYYSHLPFPWNFAMDPRFGPWPFFYIPNEMNACFCHGCHCHCHFHCHCRRKDSN